MKLFCINNQNKLINKKVQKRLKIILGSGKFILGKNVKKIENQLKKHQIINDNALFIFSYTIKFDNYFNRFLVVF